jgi:phage terminase small subunit
MEALKFSSHSVQEPPSHLGESGTNLWKVTLQAWELEDCDMVVLVTACECLDRLADIRAALASDGIVVTDPSGRQRAHPLLASEAQVHGILLRAWKQLALNDSELPKIGRPTTRV